MYAYMHFKGVFDKVPMIAESFIQNVQNTQIETQKIYVKK